MKRILFTLVAVLTISSVSAQEKFDEYEIIYREIDDGSLVQDSILKCSLLLHKVKKDMTMTDVEELTGKPSREEVLTIGNNRNIVIWNYQHEDEINHSIEFFDGKVMKVILDYPRYQKELKRVLKEVD